MVFDRVSAVMVSRAAEHAAALATEAAAAEKRAEFMQVRAEELQEKLEEAEGANPSAPALTAEESPEGVPWGGLWELPPQIHIRRVEESR